MRLVDETAQDFAKRLYRGFAMMTDPAIFDLFQPLYRISLSRKALRGEPDRLAGSAVDLDQLGLFEDAHGHRNRLFGHSGLLRQIPIADASSVEDGQKVGADRQRKRRVPFKVVG